jgi:PHD/YefM family antitoxin component YafN of YafNO toxin-antitoxin module
MDRIMEITPITTARREIHEIVDTMERDGLLADPVVIGRRGNAGAVVISVDLFRALAEQIEEIQTDALVHARVEATRAAGGPAETTVEELAATLGVSLGELGGDEHDSPAPRDPA